MRSRAAYSKSVWQNALVTNKTIIVGWWFDY